MIEKKKQAAKVDQEISTAEFTIEYGKITAEEYLAPDESMGKNVAEYYESVFYDYVERKIAERYPNASFLIGIENHHLIYDENGYNSELDEEVEQYLRDVEEDWSQDADDDARKTALRQDVIEMIKRAITRYLE